MSSDGNDKNISGFDKAFAMLMQEFRMPYNAVHDAVIKDFEARFDRFFKNKTTGKSSDKEGK